MQNNENGKNSTFKNLLYLALGGGFAIALSLGMKSKNASKHEDLLNKHAVEKETHQTETDDLIFDESKIIYVGIDNLILLDIPEHAAAELHVAAKGAEVVYIANGKCILRVQKPGAVQVTIYTASEDLRTFEYLAKRLPDPVIYLSNHQSGGKMSSGEFKAQQGFRIKIPDIGIDYKCEILGFHLTLINAQGNEESQVNVGGKFIGEAKKLITKAKPQDRFIFDKVRAKCPGDVMSRILPTIVFMIK